MEEIERKIKMASSTGASRDTGHMQVLGPKLELK